VVWITCDRKLIGLVRLSASLELEWAQLDHAIVAKAIGQWRHRLTACVKVRGGHFEHKMYIKFCGNTDDWFGRPSVFDVNEYCTTVHQ
jgi:hypothetical protein